MFDLFKTKKVSSTPFSDFIRNASSKEKKKVYKVVLVKATERQKSIIEKRRAESGSSTRTFHAQSR
ncbi:MULTISPECIES: hypothetical protein [unclassified Lysobacter]